MKIETWLENNTFKHTNFWDIQSLIREKEKKSLKVSLCIPTLNEEKTIGKEVLVFRSELMERYALIDELAVIDSGSKDKTLSVASTYGADIYLAENIIPEVGNHPGKGENLWKAIYQLEGDIICYVDADIKNIHPRFVYGLVAPLIYKDELQYVKAFYDRPLSLSKGVRSPGGGRVTEILIRPLFSLFFPELSAIIQPLSGEYAVRRTVLDKIPFPVGYGVETAHILDVYQKWGLKAFAQTDLEQRIHRNQATNDLGKMSFGILQTFLKRLEDYGIIYNKADLHKIYRQFQVVDSDYQQLTKKIVEFERPPMIEIPAYRQKFDL